MEAVRPGARVALAVLFAALLAGGAACSGEGGDTGAIPGPDTPDVSPDVPPPPPECDPAADPTGCPDGALCWFGRCAAVAEQTVPAGADAVVGAVASLADDKGGAVVAWSERATAGGAREDRILAAFLQGDQLGAAGEVDRWPVPLDEPDDPGPASPRLALARGADRAVALVRGPAPLVAYRWNSGTWEASAPLETDARLVTSEGSLAAVFDAEGRLHVAFHDTEERVMKVATLDPAGTWALASVFDLDEHFDDDTWGARLAGTAVGDSVAFALVLESESDPQVKRGAIIAELGAAGWEVTTPSLAEGLVLEGRVMGLAATSDAEGRLTLGWMPATRQIGSAVRGEDGRWTQQELPEVSPVDVSEDLHDNLAIRWWQDALVFAWLGDPTNECACFDVRLVMLRDGEWLEYRVRRMADRTAGDLDLSIDNEGRLLLPVGGGPFTDHGTAGVTVFTSGLPDWTTP